MNFIGMEAIYLQLVPQCWNECESCTTAEMVLWLWRS